MHIPIEKFHRRMKINWMHIINGWYRMTDVLIIRNKLAYDFGWQISMTILRSSTHLLSNKIVAAISVYDDGLWLVIKMNRKERIPANYANIRMCIKSLAFDECAKMPARLTIIFYETMIKIIALPLFHTTTYMTTTDHLHDKTLENKWMASWSGIYCCIRL